MTIEFKECIHCSLKSGSPELCESCLHNRNMVAQLKNIILIGITKGRGSYHARGFTLATQMEESLDVLKHD